MSRERAMLESRVLTAIGLLAGALILASLLAGCGRADSQSRGGRQVTVQMAWLHEAQAAGFFAADRTGRYAAEGLSVRLLPGGPAVDRIASVVGGMAELGVAGADELLLARSRGARVRAVAVIYRRSPIVFVAEAGSGIKRPQDFAGKTIRVVPNLVLSLRAMTARVGVRPDQYREVVLPSDLAEFRSSKAPIWGAYINGLVVTLEQAGHRLTLIFPDDYGVHFYADTLFTTDDLIARDPDLVARVVRATLEGWRFAVENPQEVGGLVRHYRADADVNLENAKMSASLPLLHTGEDSIGWMRADTWAAMEKTLRQQGALAAPLQVSDVYTLRFLGARR